MKKLLRVTFLILLLGVWFLYVVKNPSLAISQKILTTLHINLPSSWTGIDLTSCVSYYDGCNTCTVKDGKAEACTRMYCDTPAEPQCLEYAYTWIDLTNCTSYFDGCNNCTVKDGKPEACTMMYCDKPTTPKCNQYSSWSTTDTGTAGIANPASVNCENNWWTLEIITDLSGGQSWVCHLSNGTTCEERAYMRGECWVPTTGTTSSNGGTGSEWTASACTLDYTPVCASIAIQCVKAPCEPIEQTFGNACEMRANKLATYLHDGECVKK